MTTASKNQNCTEGRQFIHKNGKTYLVVAEDGCFRTGVCGNIPIYGKFGAVSMRDGKPYGPMRDMKIENVKEWL